MYLIQFKKFTEHLTIAKHWNEEHSYAHVGLATCCITNIHHEAIVCK